jgi:hypothetical protein
VALDAGTTVVPLASLKSSGKESRGAISATQDSSRAPAGEDRATTRFKDAFLRFVPARVGEWWSAHQKKLSEKGAVLMRGVFFAAWFTPAVFFVAIGICTLIAPQLVATAVAAFFVFLGLGFFALAVKFIQFKRKVERIARTFEARLVVQGVPLEKFADMQERRQGKSPDTRESLTEIRIPGSSKKILFH